MDETIKLSAGIGSCRTGRCVVRAVSVSKRLSGRATSDAEALIFARYIPYPGAFSVSATWDENCAGPQLFIFKRVGAVQMID